eukprot:jgi/Mesvir1/7307/Mv19122-RA.1
MASKKQDSLRADNVYVQKGILLNDSNMLTRLNPFEMGRFFKFVSTVSEMGHNILEFQILNPVTGAYEALGSIAPEYRQLPKHYDGEDYRPTYMKIAEYCDDDLPLDSTQSWTFSDRAGELAPFAKDSQLPSSYEWRLAEKEALLAGLRATVRQMAANAGTQDYGDWTFDASGVAQRKLTVTYRAGGHFPRELLLLVPSAFPLNNKYVVQMYMWLPLVVQAHVPAILELSIAHHQHLSNPSGPVLMDIGKVTWDNPGGGVTGLNGVLASSKVVQATDPNQQKFLDDADPDKRCPVIITSANNLIIFTDQRPIEFTVHAEGVPTSFVYR